MFSTFGHGKMASEPEVLPLVPMDGMRDCCCKMQKILFISYYIEKFSYVCILGIAIINNLSPTFKILFGIIVSCSIMYTPMMFTDN